MIPIKSVDDLFPSEELVLIVGVAADEFVVEFEMDVEVALLPSLGPRNRAPQATLLAADHMMTCCAFSPPPPHPPPSSSCDSQPPPLADDAVRPRRSMVVMIARTTSTHLARGYR